LLFLIKNSMISFNLLELVQDCNSLATAYHPVPRATSRPLARGSPLQSILLHALQGRLGQDLRDPLGSLFNPIPKSRNHQKKNLCMGPASSKWSWMRQILKLAKNVDHSTTTD
jgi:hypothetical protein